MVSTILVVLLVAALLGVVAATIVYFYAVSQCQKAIDEITNLFQTRHRR